jgi:predicted porin
MPAPSRSRFVLLTLAGLALPLLARADVKLWEDHVVLYGRIHLSVEDLRLGLPTQSTSKAHWVVLNNISRIGFKGTEKVADWASVVWQVETGVPLADGQEGGSSQLAGRESFLGLATVAGTVKGGNFYDSYDDMHYIAGNTFQYLTGSTNDATLWANGAVASTGGFDERSHNSLAYMTPGFDGPLKGLRLKVQYSLAPGGTPPLPGGEQTTPAGSFSLAAHAIYDNGPLRLGVAHRQNRRMDVSSAGFYSHGSSTMAVAGVTVLGSLYLAALGEYTELANINASNKDRHRLYGSGIARLTVADRHIFSGFYGLAGSYEGDAAIQDSGAWMGTVAYNLVLTPAAQFYVAYTYLKNDPRAPYILGASPTRAAGADYAPASTIQSSVLIGSWLSF